uniref:Uncharacterized protein n=1 Tax=Solanum lycopersicum TaxID=4081 RepID=A0A3Q7F1F1_SOLLC
MTVPQVIILETTVMQLWFDLIKLLLRKISLLGMARCMSVQVNYFILEEAKCTSGHLSKSVLRIIFYAVKMDYHDVL